MCHHITVVLLKKKKKKKKPPPLCCDTLLKCADAFSFLLRGRTPLGGGDLSGTAGEL